MINDIKPKQVGSTGDRKKSSWSTPTLSRIEANEAEVFTRSGTDGRFTFS